MENVIENTMTDIKGVVQDWTEKKKDKNGLPLDIMRLFFRSEKERLSEAAKSPDRTKESLASLQITANAIKAMENKYIAKQAKKAGIDLGPEMSDEKLAIATAKTVKASNANFPSSDEILEKGLAGQAKILKEMLEAGVPLHYEDKDGNWVQENPDGTIDILERAKK